ncbi:MAG TPA: 4-hydroxythreonine-4-phosphate dehydrogenase PdxA [Malonomonas sp.]
MKPLLVTMGDPTGIGPELLLKALLDGDFDALRRPLLVVGDPQVLLRAGRIFQSDGKLAATGEGRATLEFSGRRLQVQTLSQLDAEELRYGQPDNACGRAMADYIEWAVARCLDGSAAAMVTAPINKAAINAAGCHFPGHTELLAQRCGVEKVVMMLAGDKLKVCLVTTHLAYRDVPQALSTAEILATIRITDQAFRRQFGLEKPRLAVLSLNPHAGENGMFGDEEARLIQPAIAQAQAEGIAADGPHSADSLFHFAVNGSHDAVICMYHDQGLIPLKLLHFDDGVNVTLGLPIVRTSVDHGTAYNLAGSGTASTASLLAAIKLAEQMIP